MDVLITATNHKQAEKGALETYNGHAEPFGCRRRVRLPHTLVLTMAASRSTISRLINASQHSACPCHGSHPVSHHDQLQAFNQLKRRSFATPVQTVQKEYAFEVTYLQ